MIAAIIFDCFGVLTQDGWLAFLDKYASDSNIEQLRDLNRQEDRGMIDYDDFLTTVTELTTATKAEAHSMITANLHPNRAVFKLINELKPKYKLGVISNVGQHLSVYLPKTLLEVFDEITLSSDVGTLKPQPGIYENHLTALGVEASEAIFVDDRAPNVAGAEAVGMQGLLFESVEKLRADLQKFGVDL